jgi:O-antigen/teichoic acid export membrane protein
MTSTPSSSSPQASRRSLARDILQGTGLYSLALIAPKLASVFLLPVYTRHLSPADYAVMDLLDQACNVLAMLFGSNLSAALFFFYFQKEDPQWRRTAAATNIVGCLLAGLLFGLAGFALAAPLSALVFATPEYAPLFRLVFPMMGFSFGLEALLTLARAENRPQLYTGVSLARLALLICCTFTFLVLLKMGVRGVLLSNLLVTVAVTVFFLLHGLRRIGLRADVGLLWQMAKYSFPVGIGTLAIFVVNFADRFVLQRSVSMTELGQYSVAYKIGMLMAFVHGSFHAYWTSRAFEIVKRPDGAALFSKLFTYFMGLLSVAGLALTLATKPVLAILTTQAYREAALVVPVIVLAYCVRGAGDFLRILFFVHEEIRWDAICNWLGAAVCFLLYLWWIPLYGTWGAAFATLAAFAFVYVVVFFRVRRLLAFQLENGRLLRLLGFACLLGYGSTVLIPANTAVQVVLGTLFLLLYPLLLWSSGFFTSGELEMAGQQWAAAKRRMWSGGIQ